ncbi:MAG: hypothetical protein QXK45_06820 [Thermofilaceae archaeon]
MKRLIIVIIAAVALLWLASQLTAIITTTQPPSHQTPGAVGQTAKSNATAAEHGNTATESRRAPPGWKIEVVEQYVMEYPARRIAGDARRYVFYYWNGSLYLEDSDWLQDLMEYARYVGEVVYIEPRNETVRKIHSQNPLVYTQYNITYYPVYSYEPKANLTPVVIRDLQIHVTNRAGAWAYNISGVVPKGQVVWTLLHIADKFNNASVLTVLRVKAEIPELELNPIKVVYTTRLVLNCGSYACNIIILPIEKLVR